MNLGKQAITTTTTSVQAFPQLDLESMQNSWSILSLLYHHKAAACLHMDTVLYHQIRKKKKQTTKLVYFTKYRTQFCVATRENDTTHKDLNTDLFLLFFLFFFSFLCFLEFFLCFFFLFFDFSSEALSESDDESEDDSKSLELSESLDEEDDLCLFFSSFLAISQNNKDLDTKQL